jgi:hypothetical membrane protein
MIIAESIYPNYSVSGNYISDLGVGSTGPLFDTSISILGLAVIAASFFLYKGFGSKVFSILTFLSGLGALLVGIFNESFSGIHTLVSALTFISGGLTAIVAFRYERMPMNFFSVALGIFSLASLVVSEVVPNGFGLGVGGIERMIVYPFLLWGIGFGGYLIGYSAARSASGQSSQVS